MTQIPTLEEVKEHFKNVKKIKCNLCIYKNKIYIPLIKTLAYDKKTQAIYCDSKDPSSDCCLWSKEKGYAEIVSFKNIKLLQSKADKYFKECLLEVVSEGEWDKDPRPQWSDGTPAHSKFITQKTFEYRIDKGELPLISMRNTAIKGGWYDMEAIYQKQTNIIEEMHPSIHSWWKPFIVNTYVDGLSVKNDIGQTYGHTVKRYDLVNKLFDSMLNNPYGRRHVMNLWQEEQMKEDRKALVPCAYETLYSLSEDSITGIMNVDMTLNQRSQDFLMTASINPIQYVMLGMAICGHLSYCSGKKHVLRKFKYNVQNLHIYDRHLFAIDELLKQPIQPLRPSIKLEENKDFYDYNFEDFNINIPYEVRALSKPLELAV